MKLFYTLFWNISHPTKAMPFPLLRILLIFLHPSSLNWGLFAEGLKPFTNLTKDQPKKRDRVSPFTTLQIPTISLLDFMYASQNSLNMESPAFIWVSYRVGKPFQSLLSYWTPWTIGDYPLEAVSFCFCPALARIALLASVVVLMPRHPSLFLKGTLSQPTRRIPFLVGFSRP